MKKAISFSLLVFAAAAVHAGDILQVSDLQSIRAVSMRSGSAELPVIGYDREKEAGRALSYSELGGVAGRYHGTMPGGRPCSVTVSYEVKFGRSYWVLETAYPVKGRTQGATLVYGDGAGNTEAEIAACGKEYSAKTSAKLTVLDPIKEQSDYKVRLLDFSLANGVPSAYSYYEQKPAGSGSACAALLQKVQKKTPLFTCAGLKKESYSYGGYPWQYGGGSAAGPWDTDDGMGGNFPNGGLNDTDDGMGGGGPNGGYGGGYGPDGSGGGVDF